MEIFITSDLRPAGLCTHPQQLGHRRVKLRRFDVLEEQRGDPLPQPLQTGCLNISTHQVHLSANQIQDVPCQRALVLLSNEMKPYDQCDKTSRGRILLLNHVYWNQGPQRRLPSQHEGTRRRHMFPQIIHGPCCEQLRDINNILNRAVTFHSCSEANRTNDGTGVPATCRRPC